VQSRADYKVKRHHFATGPGAVVPVDVFLDGSTQVRGYGAGQIVSNDQAFARWLGAVFPLFSGPIAPRFGQ
jgi:hypothetical protein